MQKSESRTRGKPRGLDLDLSPPVRVGLWAVTLAAGIIFGTVAPPLGVALVFASLLISAGAIYWRDLVPESWSMMAVLAPLFAAGGVSIASLHLATPDPLAELAAMRPGEVTVVGKIASPPVRGGLGYRADLQVEHLWYEEKEVLRGGRLQVFAAPSQRLHPPDAQGRQVSHTDLPL